MKIGLSRGGAGSTHLNWWQDLVGIPGINDFQQLTQKIWASFKLPPVQRVKPRVLTMTIQHHQPPSASAGGNYLPPPNLMFPSQDFREGQSQKTLAYAQALQYWVEKANPLTHSWPHLLVRCVQELRKVMEPYVAFSNDAIQERSLEERTWAPIPVETQAVPTEEPTEELAPAEVSIEGASPQRSPQRNKPCRNIYRRGHSHRRAHQRDDPCSGIYRGGSPYGGAQWGTGYPYSHGQWADWRARCSPCAAWGERKGEVPHSNLPGWTEVMHPSQTMITAGQAPLTISKLRQQHHSQRVGRRRAKECRGPCRRNMIHHHQSPWCPYQRFHCPQASRGFQPACWGIHPLWLPLRLPQN